MYWLLYSEVIRWKVITHMTALNAIITLAPYLSQAPKGNCLALSGSKQYDLVSHRVFPFYCVSVFCQV